MSNASTRPWGLVYEEPALALHDLDVRLRAVGRRQGDRSVEVDDRRWCALPNSAVRRGDAYRVGGGQGRCPSLAGGDRRPAALTAGGKNRPRLSQNRSARRELRGRRRVPLRVCHPRPRPSAAAGLGRSGDTAGGHGASGSCPRGHLARRARLAAAVMGSPGRDLDAGDLGRDELGAVDVEVGRDSLAQRRLGDEDEGHDRTAVAGPPGLR